MNISFYPVIIDRWIDFEQLFECKGGPHNCWCSVWRINEYRKSIPGKSGKKASMYNRVKKGIPVGLLAYHKNNPIGWCSIAPRETYKTKKTRHVKALWISSGLRCCSFNLGLIHALQNRVQMLYCLIRVPLVSCSYRKLYEAGARIWLAVFLLPQPYVKG